MLFISAGHNPKAKGATFKDFNEYDEAVLWREQIVDLLGADKAMAVPTGTLGSKVRFINKEISYARGPHIAIEIHFNSDPQRAGKGSETLYYPKSRRGQQLAISMQDKLSIIFGPNRGAKEGWYQMNPAKGSDYFLARTNCPALIIEPEFVHNAEKIIEARVPGCTIVANSLLEMTRGN